MQSSKLTKTFVLEQAETQQSTIIDSQICMDSEIIDLTPLLQRHIPATQASILLYDPNTHRFVSLAQIDVPTGFVPASYLEPQVILIRFRKKLTSNMCPQTIAVKMEQSSEGSFGVGKSKKRERTIAEVLELVKKWRQLHTIGHPTLHRRLNLQDAAKVVHVSKKSLDDYYCQLRLGELYCFDFQNNLHQKIGLLRNYVKYYRPSKMQSSKKQHDRHPKELKILHEYDLKTHSFKTQAEYSREKQHSMVDACRNRAFQLNEAQQMKGVLQKYNEGESAREVVSFFNFESTPASKESLFNLEHNFFKVFQLPFNQYEDPYQGLSYEGRENDLELDSQLYSLQK